jgi:hypothetical protein
VAGRFDSAAGGCGVIQKTTFSPRFRMMDEFGEYCQVISLPTPALESFANATTAPLLATMANDGMAELVARYPHRFVGFAAACRRPNPILGSQRRRWRHVLLTMEVVIRRF